MAEGGLQPKADEAAVDVFEFTNALPLDSIGSLVLRCKHRGPLYRSALGRRSAKRLAGCSTASMPLQQGHAHLVCG